MLSLLFFFSAPEDHLVDELCVVCIKHGNQRRDGKIFTCSVFFLSLSLRTSIAACARLIYYPWSWLSFTLHRRELCLITASLSVSLHVSVAPQSCVQLQQGLPCFFGFHCWLLKPDWLWNEQTGDVAVFSWQPKSEIRHVHRLNIQTKVFSVNVSIA